MTELIVIALAGFLSAIIKNGVGVGSGIFLLPTLSLVFPAKVALGIGAPLMLGSDILGLRYYWRQWSTQDIKRLALPALLGMLLGTWLIPIIPTSLFNAGVGIFGMLYAVFLLFPQARCIERIKKCCTFAQSMPAGSSAIFYGTFGGIATIMAHAGGLVWSMYLMTTCTDRRIFVGTIVCMFCVTNTYKVLAYLNIGLLTLDQLFMAALALPAIYLGAFVGNWVNKNVNQLTFKRMVLVTIFIVSASLLCK